MANESRDHNPSYPSHSVLLSVAPYRVSVYWFGITYVDVFDVSLLEAVTAHFPDEFFAMDLVIVTGPYRLVQGPPLHEY